MKIVAIIQARMGSTRLPGKALLDICGEPMLARVMTRCRRAKTLEPGRRGHHDRAGRRRALRFVRRPRLAVLPRQPGRRAGPLLSGRRGIAADVVVRITSDCPLIDPDVIDLTVSEFLRLQPDCDYVSNGEPPRPFPRGLDVEALHFRTLEQAWREARDAAFREHVTLYVYRHPEKFRCVPGAGRPRLLG